MGFQDTALVYLNGHMVNDCVRRLPQDTTRFCQECGAKSISQCPSCNADIRGEYHVEDVFVLTGLRTPPSYCHNCGTAYSWTETGIEAARELIGLADRLSPEEKEDFGNAVADLARESPRTTVAVEKLKRYSAKAGKAIGDGIWKIAVEVATEATKKMLLS